MVEWSQLLLPALLSAVLVFVASSLIHMVLKLHNRDYRKLGNEDEVREAFQKGAPTPGQYVIPHCLDPKDAASPQMKARFEEGPVAMIFVRPTGLPKLGPFLCQWFAYSFVVALFAGYVARAALPAQAAYLSVFQVVGASAWLAYAWQSPADSIWRGKPWSVTVREMIDGLVYAALTAGAFAGFWPR